jgi:hypothetical protein
MMKGFKEVLCETPLGKRTRSRSPAVANKVIALIKLTVQAPRYSSPLPEIDISPISEPASEAGEHGSAGNGSSQELGEQ